LLFLFAFNNQYEWKSECSVVGVTTREERKVVIAHQLRQMTSMEDAE